MYSNRVSCDRASLRCSRATMQVKLREFRRTIEPRRWFPSCYFVEPVCSGGVNAQVCPFRSGLRGAFALAIGLVRGGGWRGQLARYQLTLTMGAACRQSSGRAGNCGCDRQCGPELSHWRWSFGSRSATRPSSISFSSTSRIRPPELPQVAEDGRLLSPLRSH